VPRSYVAINNYEIGATLVAVDEGRLPRHLLYGLDRVIATSDAVSWVDRSESLPARSARRVRPKRLGASFDPAQLSRALLRATREHSTLLALNAFCLGNVALASLAGPRRPKVVGVVHASGSPRYARFLARYLDGALCLSERAAAALTSAGLDNVAVGHWGPDLSFQAYAEAGEPEGELSVAAFGRTGRDFDTLLGAIAALGVRACVNVPKSTPLPPTAVSLSDVAARAGVGGFDATSYDRPIAGWRETSVVAIPLHPGLDGIGMVGLTEVNDALALGRPLVMTRSERYDFDLEALGIGLWVEPGSVDDWCRALEELRNDPARRTEMGVNARTYAESSWNSERFSSALDGVLRRCDAG
jgi:glycosyltransferase involved in cell wall biosynthesis